MVNNLRRAGLSKRSPQQTESRPSSSWASFRSPPRQLGSHLARYRHFDLDGSNTDQLDDRYVAEELNAVGCGCVVRSLLGRRLCSQMCALQCSAFLVSAIAIKPVNESSPPAAIKQFASTIGLSQSKGSRSRLKRAFRSLSSEVGERRPVGHLRTGSFKLVERW